MASYNVHGGHNPSGKIACGASDLLDESKEDRKIAKAIIKYLKKEGATAYNCTVSNGTSQMDVLKKICEKCNKHNVRLDASIHLNSGRNDHKGDKKIGGFEVWATAYTGLKKEVAKRAVANMKKLGFTSHGDPYKTKSNLYYLNHTKAKALLFEICFVDDKDDYLLYKTVGADAIGKAIAEAIVGHAIKTSATAKVAAVFKTGVSVKIVGNAKYGGSANGKDVPSAYIGKKYTVTKVQTNNGQQEALIKQLNSWVPTKYLQIV
ncbi:N-acetylmuramoyl-L-alanine amidase [Anaerostipes faecalis]|uniref:N-acetylmuramoyl-L-alanine amidase n=1 Tax=Anaerostipes faecalis TaxID=2738446 RepID=UPI001C1E33C2|nr:N-acetylmuramoyl-L-alanine amidase [Anaerostipes faecalis]